MTALLSPPPAPPTPATRAPSATRRAVLGFGLLFVVPAIAYTGAELVDRMSSVTVTTTAAYDGTALAVDVASGNVAIAPSPDQRVHVTRRDHLGIVRPESSAEVRDGVVRLSGRCPAGVFSSCSVDYEVQVPAGLPVSVHASAGDVRASDLAGRLDVTTSGGDVTLRRVSGELLVQTSAGDVTATGIASATVSARTSAGDVSLGFALAPDSVTATTGAGDVSVLVPPGDAYRVSATTGVGTKRVALHTDSGAPRALTVGTGAGDVDLRYTG